MTLTWIASACVIAAASFVMGLAGFGIALVSMAVLPFLMSPVTAVILMTIYALVFALALLAQLRRDVMPRAILELVVGSIVGTPLGVWGLATMPPAVLNRVIGALLLAAVGLEWWGRYPQFHSRSWGYAAGAVAGVAGGAVGLPGPPVILYAAARGWEPRTMKANLQAFFAVNQAVILAGYWWAGLLTPEIGRLTVLYAAPAVAGIVLGAMLFEHVDHVSFRRIVFALLFVSAVALVVWG
jgi:uncharacterized membrane protein YfcA